MRLVVLIIGLLLGLLMFLQTFLVNVLGQAARDKATEQAGAVGVAAALLWLLACAFVMPWPLVSVGSFLLAASLSFSVSGDFPDQLYWGHRGAHLGCVLVPWLAWEGPGPANQSGRTSAASRARCSLRGVAHGTGVPAPGRAVSCMWPAQSCRRAILRSLRYEARCVWPAAWIRLTNSRVRWPVVRRDPSRMTNICARVWRSLCGLPRRPNGCWRSRK